MSPDRKAESIHYSKPTPKEENQALFPDHELDQVRDIPTPPEFEKMYVSFAARERQDDNHERMEDAIYINHDKYIFGVFDGAGGASGNPAAASHVASEEVGRALSSSGNVVTTYAAIEDDLRTAFEKGQKAVKERGEGGVTVATAAKLYNVDGRPMLGVAHAGDTRMFVYEQATQKYISLTPDQSDGSRIKNWLADSEHQTEQNYYTFIPVQTGDRVMMCSDGITGDYANQAFSREEFTEAFTQLTANEAAQKFLEISMREGKKRDDKSVIVFDIDTIDNQPVKQPVETTREQTPGVSDVRQKQSGFAKRLHQRAIQLGLSGAATPEQIKQAQDAKLKARSSASVLPPVPLTPPKSASKATLATRSTEAALVTPDPAPNDERDMDDEERQFMIDQARGFRIIDNRTWDRDAVPPISPNHTVTSANTDTSPSNSVETTSGTDPRAGTWTSYARDVYIPLQPDHAPTIHHNFQSATADSAPDEEKKPTVKDRLMDKINAPFQHLATRLTWAHMILRSQAHESQGGSNKEKESRRKIITRVIGVAAVVAVAAVLSRDNPDFQSTASDLLNGSSGGGDLNPLQNLPQGGVDHLQERIIEQHAEILNSPTHVIPFNGGGEQYAIANGVDPALWRQHQYEFLQQFPQEGYPMDDGNVGFRRPGELSDDAKVFWSKKFGKWL